jgi:EpsI family protein
LALWRVGGEERLAQPLQLALPELAGRPASADAAPLLEPVFVGAAAQATRNYAADGGSVTLHIAYYRDQGYGRKLASSANTLTASDDQRWNRVASSQVSQLVEGQGISLRTAELVGGNWRHSTAAQRLEVRQIHWAGGRFTSSGQWATVLSVASRLAGNGDDAATLTFYTEGDAGQTSTRLNSFIAAHLPAIRSRLQEVAARR